MACNCRLTLVSNPNGHTLTAVINGDFAWENITRYPGLPVGDPNAPVSDKNPIAFFQDLFGAISTAMTHEGVSDSNNDPNILEFNNIDRIDACKFQWLLIKAAEKLSELGQRLAVHKVPSQKKFDLGRINQSWRVAQNSGRKGKSNGGQSPKSSP